MAALCQQKMSSQFSLFPHPAPFFFWPFYIFGIDTRASLFRSPKMVRWQIIGHFSLPLALSENPFLSPQFPFHCKWTPFNRNGIGNIFFDAKWSKISSDPWNEEYILNSGWNYSTSTADATQFFLKNIILLSREDLSGTFDRDNAKQSDPKEGSRAEEKKIGFGRRRPLVAKEKGETDPPFHFLTNTEARDLGRIRQAVLYTFPKVKWV